jgi:hypothetical protein
VIIKSQVSPDALRLLPRTRIHTIVKTAGMTGSQTLEGKLAIVSGSAKGIGAATCVELASR